MIIEQATIEDTPGIIKLVKEGQKEIAAYHMLSFAEEKTVSYIEDLINRSAFVGVVKKPFGGVVGYLLGTITDEFYSDDSVGRAIAFYISPKYRGGRKTVKLIGYFIDWCKDNNCKKIIMGISTGNMSVHRLYLKMGFLPVGYQYIHSEDLI